MEFITLVSKQDYLDFSGIDLDYELVGSVLNDAGDSPAPRFIYGIEDWCIEHLKANYDWNGMFANDYQKNQFKKGVMHQISYYLKNGNVSNDAGYNQSTLQIIDRALLDRIALSPNAKKCFRNGGMANLMRW